jgi:hypothetical protein
MPVMMKDLGTKSRVCKIRTERREKEGDQDTKRRWQLGMGA